MSTYDNDNANSFNGYLPGSNEAEMDAMLNELGRAERDSAPAGLDAGVLDAIAGAIAPAPIAIEQPMAASGLWFGGTLRYAAAAVLVGGAALTVMLVQFRGTPVAPVGDANMIAVTIESDIDSLLALDEMNEELDESVAEWTIWAQAVDSDLNSAWMALDLMDSSFDENGAL